jgi:integrase
MKVCVYCDKSMKPQNFSKHCQRCVIKKAFGIPKQAIMNLIQGSVHNQQHDQLALQVKQSKLESFVQKLVEEAGSLIDGLKNFSPESKLDEMVVSPQTLYCYKSEWKLYSTWCQQFKLDAFKSASANSYLAQTQKRISTMKKKKSQLQSILQFLLEKPIVLSKIRRRISITPKYTMTHQEVVDYLDEQYEVSPEDYLIQLILINYGCRIHSVACLRLKHIDFPRNKMFLPDSKTGTREVNLNEEITKELKNYVNVNKIKDNDNYLFSASSAEGTRRSAQICKRINSRIKMSKVLARDENHKFSSHMFRKTVAHSLYRHLIAEAKNSVRKAIGQAEGSSAVEYYIS